MVTLAIKTAFHNLKFKKKKIGRTQKKRNDNEDTRVVGQRVEGEETVKMKVILKAKVKEKEEKKYYRLPPPTHTHTHKTVSTNVPYTYTIIWVMEDARSHADRNV